MIHASTYYHGQPVRYIGPKPERDAPKWMNDLCSFRYMHIGGTHVEIFTTSGTQHVQAAYIEAA